MAIQSLKSTKKPTKEIVKLSLRQRTGFFGCGKEWYHFQQELMVSKTTVKPFS